MIDFIGALAFMIWLGLILGGLYTIALPFGALAPFVFGLGLYTLVTKDNK